MKRPLTICAIIVLSALIAYACGSTIPTGNTSFVTITIGGGAGQSAKVHAEKATAWARFKNYLADAKIMPEAQAYIPSVVQVLVVTVSAADIATPIVGIDSLTPDQTTATIRIEVPNGAARQFTIEGIRGIDSKTYFRGTATADLDGTDVNLPIIMSFVGPGIWVDPSRPLSANTTTCGATQATACATISHVLNSRPATTNNDVILALAGNYIPGSVAAIESFPLQLKTGTALICLGPDLTSVILPNTTAFYGADRASIDNCRIIASASLGNTVIDDRPGGQSASPSRMTINASQVEIEGTYTNGTMVGIDLWNDSLVIETAVTGTGTGAFGTISGIRVSSGKPTIGNSAIAHLPTGIELGVNAGDAVITGNTIEFNNGNPGGGIIIAAAAKPKISANRISNNFTGIWIQAGDPEISGNSLDHNNVGIEASFGAGSPTIQQNSLFCSYNADLFSTAMTTINAANNSWDHDSTTVPPGPEERVASTGGRFDCAFGADICAQAGGPMPIYLPANAAVPNGCLFPSPN